MNKRFFLLFCAAVHVSVTVSASDALWTKLRRNQRRIFAHTVASAAADFNEAVPVPMQLTNGDEQRYSDKRGNYNKLLKHLPTGFPDTQAYASLIHALETGNPADFDVIQMGGNKHLHSPQSAFAFDFDANDPWIYSIATAPRFDSAETAGEMVENYWSVLLRDVPFDQFTVDGTAMAAVADLNSLSDFKGPRGTNGQVTGGTLLRGNTSGDLVGPFISQLLYKPIPFIALPTIIQTVNEPNAVDFMKTFSTWFSVMNGATSFEPASPSNVQKFIYTPRTLAEYLRKDWPCSPGITAALILNALGAAALDPAHFYTDNPTQDGFVTFGLSELITLIQQASNAALKATWYQKWLVDRRVRPEEFGFYVNESKIRGIDLGIHTDLLDSPVLPLIFAANPGTYFLSQAYPEGCPPHPSYPAGHASFIGAAVTILKAWFNEGFVIPSPMVPNGTGSALVPFVGAALTIGGELNKFASNISLGRDMAGVHYRSDAWQGMLLGEKVAIDILNRRGFLINENFKGFSLTTFEGKNITVGRKLTV